MIRCVLAVCALLLSASAGFAASVDDLVRAYPDALWGFDGANLIWRDGTRMPVDEGRPSILDQLRLVYPVRAALTVPDDDPGRARNVAFFDKMYGDCRRGEVAPHLVPVVWLPRSWGHVVRITSVNGVDQHLAAVSRELDELPADQKRFLYPIGGTYTCRPVADTGLTSMHGWGAAIDLNPRLTDYWLWRHGTADYVNRLPADIVAIFERHGFIWGGRWSHYDTMHFEYRPELVGPVR